MSILTGTSGNDTLIGGLADDALYGLDGEEHLDAAGGCRQHGRRGRQLYPKFYFSLSHAFFQQYCNNKNNTTLYVENNFDYLTRI